MSKVFKTQSGAVLALRPVSADLCVKCVKVERTAEGQSEEELKVAYQELLTEFFEEGIVKFELTKYQAALVTVARPELKKVMPGLKKNISDFAFYIHYLVPTYEESTELAQAILDVTRKQKPARVVHGPFGLFDRVALARKQAG